MSNRERFIITITAVALILTLSAALRADAAAPAFVPDPVQIMAEDTSTVSYYTKEGTVKLNIRAEYEVSGVIRGKKYYHSDAASIVSPVDFIMAWGILNRADVAKEMKYSQSGRWYWYRYGPELDSLGIDPGLMSSNMHLIPADSKVLSKLKKAKTGQYICLKGYLVDVDFGAGRPLWRTSLSRQDAGDGACEIMYVEEALFLNDE